MPPAAPISVDRLRLSLDLAPGVALLLDHVSTVSGVPKSQIATQALLDALPGLLERADAFQKREQTLKTEASKRGGAGGRRG
jgi:hypothetical protein